MPSSPPSSHRSRRISVSKRQPTIETVAERAGVSRQTVSNVLNAPERVLANTRERVQVAIDELGYRPSRLGSALQSRTTRTFAYRCHVSEEEENLLLDRFLHELCRAATLRGHFIVLISPTDEDGEVAAYDDMFRTGSVDGFILSGTYPGDRRLAALHEQQVPYVSFGRDWDHPEYGGWVDIDGAAGIAEAVHHFWNAGHRRVAWIGGMGEGSYHERREGYRRAIHDLAGTPLELDCVDDIDHIADAATQALASPNPPTAFVCTTDVAAVGCARAAAALNLKIGSDLGIIGFDDTRFAQATTPQLSSIRQPTDVVAQLLIDGLINQVASGEVMESQMLTPTLVHRGSS